MNLESKELPESFLVQVIWEWLTIRYQTMLSPHPHTSVTSLCAETMQSGWWVLSVIPWWKIFHAHEGSIGAVEVLFPLQSLQNSGAAKVETVSLPLFLFLSLLSCAMFCNLLQTDHDRRTSAVVSTKNKVVQNYYTLPTCQIPNTFLFIFFTLDVYWKSMPSITSKTSFFFFLLALYNICDSPEDSMFYIHFLFLAENCAYFIALVFSCLLLVIC